MNGETVNISLSREEALTLFEMLFRYEQEQKLPKKNEAENEVLWNLMTYLEESLREPFGAEYEELFLQAREKLMRRSQEE